VAAVELARYVEGEELLEWSLAYSAEHGFEGFISAGVWRLRGRISEFVMRSACVSFANPATHRIQPFCLGAERLSGCCPVGVAVGGGKVS
jgi:hypothetical protein